MLLVATAMQKLTLHARRLQPCRLSRQGGRHRFTTSTNRSEEKRNPPRSDEPPSTRNERSRDSFRRLTLLSNNRGNPPLTRPQAQDTAVQRTPREIDGGEKLRRNTIPGAGGVTARKFPIRRDVNSRGDYNVNAVSGSSTRTQAVGVPASRKGDVGGHADFREIRKLIDFDADDEEESTAETLLENYPDSFHSLDEADNYGRTVELIDRYYAQNKDEEEVDRPTKTTESQQDSVHSNIMDDAIIEAMDNLIQVDDRNRPRHVPGDSWSAAAPADAIGDVPVGGLGMGNTIEESMQHLARRTGNLWETPQGLAQRLTDGDLVKFRTPSEKREVMNMAEHMEQDPDVRYGTLHVGFEPLQGEDKAALIKRLVSGQYQNDNPAWAELSADAARILGANPSYNTPKRAMFMDSVGTMRPRPSR